MQKATSLILFLHTIFTTIATAFYLMNYFIIGDVHGCYHTCQTLIERHWNSDTDILIQLGDLIDRGNYSPQTVDYFMDLQQKYPNKVICLRGNHEQDAINYLNDSSINWLRNGGKDTIDQYASHHINFAQHIAWFDNLPLCYETDAIMVSHAGISNIKNPFDTLHPDGVLWCRKPLKNIGKIQIVGHTPQTNGHPNNDEQSNTWYIDTGAVYGGTLSAIYFKNNILSGIYTLPVLPLDTNLNKA